MASDSVQQIKERLSILDVVAPYVELHKAGAHYKGKSPFTTEKTPSFFVSPDRGMYYCFSSSQGGDMFTFVQVMEGVDFKGALKILADKAGVTLQTEDPKKRNERDTQYAILDAATAFYASWLAEVPDAEQYLRDRGVTDTTIGAWRIGYAPGPPNHGWRHLRDHLHEKQFTDEQITKAGLIKSAQGGGKAPYDVFRDRIVFPICDTSGRVIAFSGRILSSDSDMPKYVNSPETELFHKSDALFGYDKAKQGIRQYDFSLIVEGQFDVVLAHQVGYTNTVAVSGTAMTAHHVSLLQRLSDRVVLALDADTAGVAAVKRSAELMLARGCDVKVARLPQGEDPADIIAVNPKRFRDIVGSATHVIEFLLGVLYEHARDERTYKLRVRDEVVPFLLVMQSHIDREHFVGVIAEKLGTTKDSIQLEIARLERERATTLSAQTTPDTTDAVETSAAETPPVARKERLAQYCVALDEVLPETERAVLGQIFVSITGRTIETARGDMEPDVISPLLFQLERDMTNMSPRARHIELAAVVQELKELTLKTVIRDLRTQLAEAERLGEESTVSDIMNRIVETQRAFSEPPYTAEQFAASDTSDTAATG